MALNFPDPHTHNGKVPDLTVEISSRDGARKRYGAGFQNVPPEKGVGHVGVVPELSQDTLNERLANGSLPPAARDVFDRAGWDGAALTYQDWSDLHFLMDPATGTTYARSLLDAILAAEPRPAPPAYDPPNVDHSPDPWSTPAPTPEPPHPAPYVGGDLDKRFASMEERLARLEELLRRIADR